MMPAMEVMNCLTLKDLGSSKKVKNDTTSHGKHAHKENIFVDRSRSTPMKNEPIDLSKQKGFTPERSPITPIKLIDKTQSEPWTPTANLKMLISAASPDIRDREKKKELFRPIENNAQDDGAPETVQAGADAVDDGTVDDYEKRPSRKQKSLGLLCQKFLARYPSYPLSTEKTTISLDEVAATLGVERRRIYDIVNVLESLHIVSRVAKNQYSWHGLHDLKQTLKNLHCLGTMQKYNEQIAFFQHKEGDSEHKVGGRKKDNMTFQSRHVLDLAEVDCHSASANSRKDKSLRIMSQKFVMLFLVSSTNIVTLEIAAKILIEESQDVTDQGKFKTKVRRLYDIANVLTSLGLIKKVHVTEERGRKPAFKWIGPTDFNALCSDQRVEVTPTTAFQGLHSVPSSQSQTSNPLQTFSRHAPFNAAHVPEEDRRTVSSEPSSPDGGSRDSGVSSDDLCTKKERQVAVCREETERNAKSRKPSPEKSRFAEDLSAATPFPVVFPVPGESESCLKSTQTTSPAPQSTMSHVPLQNGMLGHPTATADHRKPALLTSQPFVYLPSASVYMLYHNLRDSPATENLTNAGDCCRSDYDSWASPDRSSVASSAASPCSAGEDEEPAAKTRKTDLQEDALSLVLPKKHSKPTELNCLQQDSCLPAEQWGDHRQTRCHSPVIAEEQDLTKSYAFNGQKNMALHMDHSEPVHLKETFLQENMASIPQYLYVPSSACLNGFNFFLSANQSTGAVALSPSQLSPLNVPCVMVPSSSLSQFPFLCSPSIAGHLPTAPSTSATNVGSMNFNTPGMASATHLLIGAASMVASKTDESPSEPLQACSPVLGSEESSVKTGSPVCRGQPLAMKNLQQSSTPQTPKNIHRTQHETFFKTPGSFGSPISWRRSEGALRSSSSAQRRLQISGAGTE
ncbi:transcription factor E2F7 isoform X1 [Pleurodeles waltl]